MSVDFTDGPAAAAPVGLLSGYHPLPGVADAMVGSSEGLNEPWAQVAPVLDRLGQRELIRRRDQAARLLADDGVEYQVSAGPSGIEQRWELDPVPVLLSSSQWAEIERGAIQRAELLNLVLTDLYGPRDLLRRGLVAPELVFGHPGFLREADQIRLPGPQQLFTCAIDLARDAQDRTWVLSDRAQTPSGAGFALENRVVVSRVFPTMYRNAQVHRLAPFFRTLRSGLRAAAPAAVADPRIVVLTPGPWSASAFEHAFLASYLGFPLVEGSDLTVRDGRVWMRSLGRPEPVDVILRRVDSAYCDPLELRSESLLGVPGLVEAARLGAVSIVNTLGSGVLENPGLLAILPRLCEHLLGQQLRLPSVPTWWCGEDDGRRHVLANLDELVLKRITRELGAETVRGWEISTAEREDLRRRIAARPHDWVGQDRLDLSTVPTLTPDGLVPRRSTMRAFLVATNDSYAAMPGGLARVTATADGVFIAEKVPATSKDVWVVSSEPEDAAGFWLQTGTPVGATAAPIERAMPARAAENMFWLGRYAERAEAVVRMLRVVGDRRSDFPDGVNRAGTACLRSLLTALTRITGTRPGFVEDSLGSDTAAAFGIDIDAELGSLTTDSSRPGTLAFAVRRLRDAAYPVRDQLAPDTWIVVGALERDLLEPTGPTPPDMLGRVLTSLLALGGIAGEAMVRDQAWWFLEAGRRVERGIQLCALLRTTVTSVHDNATDSLLLESVLTAAESILTYRRRYRSHAQLATVLDLLLLDPGNPRSVGYQVNRLAEAVGAVANRDGTGRLTATERLVLETSTSLQLTELQPLVELGADGRRTALHQYLAQLTRLFEQTADAIDAAHFTHLLPQQTMPAGPADAPNLRLV